MYNNPYQNFINATSPYSQQQQFQNGWQQPQQPMQQQPQMIQPQQVTPQAPQMSITKVNGENGAKAFQMGVSSNVLLLDENNPIVWFKSTDGAGYPTLIGYNITPFDLSDQTNGKPIEDRVKNLEDLMEGFINERKSNNANVAKSKPNVKSNANAKSDDVGNAK